MRLLLLLFSTIAISAQNSGHITSNLNCRKKLQQNAPEGMQVRLNEKITAEYIRKNRVYHLESVYEWEQNDFQTPVKP